MNQVRPVLAGGSEGFSRFMPSSLRFVDIVMKANCVHDEMLLSLPAEVAVRSVRAGACWRAESLASMAPV
jgi:hypothetical protein